MERDTERTQGFWRGKQSENRMDIPREEKIMERDTERIQGFWRGIQSENRMDIPREEKIMDNKLAQGFLRGMQVFWNTGILERDTE